MTCEHDIKNTHAGRRQTDRQTGRGIRERTINTVAKAIDKENAIL